MRLFVFATFCPCDEFFAAFCPQRFVLQRSVLAPQKQQMNEMATAMIMQQQQPPPQQFEQVGN